jgi:alkaline phosphatase
MKKILLGLLLVLSANACRTPSATADRPQRPRNVILMVGDGMGLTQITAGYIANGMKLHLIQFPIVGLHKNFPVKRDGLITDSAAGATSFACGVKTYNAAIGVDADSLPVPTLVELAEQQGLFTGVVATSSLVHATPGSFLAHAKHRNFFEEIALDIQDVDVDLLIGGGKKYFDRRADRQNLVEKMKSRNYVVYNWVDDDLAKIQPDPAQKFVFFTSDSEPLPVAQGRDYLPGASALACDFLKQKGGGKKGFFLVVEGSQIDWGGHANESDYLVSEMIDFDNAIGRVLDFARRDGNTLVIVTADHECGAYSILKGSTQDSLKTHFASDYHTPDMIPVFAFGPGAEEFTGVYENSDIFHKIKKLLFR